MSSLAWYRGAACRRVSLGLAFALSIAALPACSASDVGGTGNTNDNITDEDDDEPRDAGMGKDSGRDASKPNRDPDEDDDDTGDDDDDDQQSCAAIRKDAPPGKGAVDIVFIIDTSASMLHALSQVTMNMAKFVQSFEGTNADTRVVMITGMDPAAGTPLAQDAQRYRFILSPVDSKALFTVALALYPQYSSFLRQEATTQFVMITDDNDAIPPAQFKQMMEQQLGRPFIQHAIASENVMGIPCTSEAALKTNPLCMLQIPGLGTIPALCQAAAIGATYYTLADDTEGAKMSICKEDWTTVFEQLKAAVIAAVPLPCEYPLTDATGASFDPDQVSIVYESSDKKEEDFPKALTPDRCTDKIGWHYDDNAKPTTIKLCPAACTKVQKGGSIDIALGCPPRVFL